ncbi:MAG: hypothetical protein RLN82_01410, partial [Pseudomonadales bacterium]
FEETFFGLDVFSDDEDIPAKILNDGTLIVNPGTGRIDGGSLCDEIDCDSRLYFAEINNALNFRLKPWGEAYVGSAFFRFDEYALNDFEDTTLSCLLALSQVQEGFTEENLASLTEDAFETLIESLADQPGAAATLASECTHNAVGHEVLAISFAKEASDHTLADLEGSWGVVGFEVGHEFERGAFSSVVTIDGQGAMQESDYRGFYALPDDDGQGNVSVRIEADTQALSGTASIDADGFVGFDFGEGVDTGFISSDEGLIYIGGRDAGNNEFQELEGEAFVAYGVPLGTGVTAADIDGKTFSFVGLSMSLEGGLTAGNGQVSSNHDSNAGMTISFASTANGLVATLGGSTDLGILDQTFLNGEVTGYASSIEMDDPADGEVNVDLESNGAFTVRIDGDTA